MTFLAGFFDDGPDQTLHILVAASGAASLLAIIVFPLVLCIFPATFIIILGPVAIKYWGVFF